MSHHDRREAFRQRQQFAEAQARAEALAAQVRAAQMQSSVDPISYNPDLSAIRQNMEFQTAMQLDQWGAMLRARFGVR